MLSYLKKPKQNQTCRYLLIPYVNGKEKAGDACGFKETCHVCYNWIVAEFFLQIVDLLVTAGILLGHNRKEGSVYLH